MSGFYISIQRYNRNRANLIPGLQFAELDWWTLLVTSPSIPCLDPIYSDSFQSSFPIWIKIFIFIWNDAGFSKDLNASALLYVRDTRPGKLGFTVCAMIPCFLGCCACIEPQCSYPAMNAVLPAILTPSLSKVEERTVEQHNSILISRPWIQQSCHYSMPELKCLTSRKLFQLLIGLRVYP